MWRPSIFAPPSPLEDRRRGDVGGSRLRLQTIVRLRWFAVLGQLITVGVVHWGLGFHLPIGFCLALIALSAWLNVFLRIRHPARHRLGPNYATALLAYDVLQLGALLYLTGGITNPFIFLIVAPVTVSAATQPPRYTVGLGALALTVTALLVQYHQPLPWRDDELIVLPMLYSLGLFASVASGMVFLTLYAWRLTKEARQMSQALAATELVLAREQRLHALDGLAAAAAHELGTPLATITVVAKELARELPKGSPHAEDIELLISQSQRCREILRKLTRSPTEQDPMHASITVLQLIDEAAEAYRAYDTKINVKGAAAEGASGSGREEPKGQRRPGVIFGLGNLIENAADFARSRVDVTAEWSARHVTVRIADDGPGFPPDIIDVLGEPYVTTRATGGRGRNGGSERAGLGLGFFIAKTLLERSGATLELGNRKAPERGAVVTVTWPRPAFERFDGVDQMPQRPVSAGVQPGLG